MIEYIHIKNKEQAAKYIPKEFGKEIIKDRLSKTVWKDGVINDKYIDILVYLFLENPDPKQRGLFIAVDDSVFVGFLAAMVNNGALVVIANELIWNVIPEYRGKGVGKELLKMYENWAKENGITKITMSHYVDDYGDSLSHTYLENGFTLTELTYSKDVK